VFEVVDANGRTWHLKNVQSIVSVQGSSFRFRNPPMFNRLAASEVSVADAEYETEAVLDHLFFHKNTPPFLAFHFIQRFGNSNPSPRYIRAVAEAFQSGSYENGQSSFGTGTYGDLKATIAAVLLDRESRSAALDNDPSHGALREPILKVTAVLRAGQYATVSPLIELDLMDEKIGQMAYEQSSVFSFFRPQYTPAEFTSLGLASPEAEIMSSGKVVGLLNGLFTVVKHGLVKCDVGFGVYGDCTTTNSSQAQTFQMKNSTNYSTVLYELSDLLTGGRLGSRKLQAIVATVQSEKDPNNAVALATQLVLTSPEFHSTSKIDPRATGKKMTKTQLKQVQKASYKVVIQLALVGGCDSFNVLVPSAACSSLHQEYMDMRGAIALDASYVLPLNGNNGTTQPCEAFTVNSALSMLQQLYNDQDLLFMANVGVLTEPCDKSNCKLKTETQLFAHNTMQDEISSLDPFNTMAGTSPLGRMADMLQAQGYATGRTTVESTPSRLAGRSAEAPAVVTLDQNGVKPFHASPALNSVIQQLNGEANTKSGVYGEVWSSLLRRSLNQTKEISHILDSTPTRTSFPRTKLGKRLKLVAQIVADRQERGVDRDFFFVSFDGFDTHSEVKLSLQEKFVELNEALAAFVSELKLLGVWDDSVILQTSDFGRTLTENTSGGTDHGWGGHYWLAGGSVNGQRIMGEYPSTLYPDGELSYDRGRFIPTTPWDSIFHAIAGWVGIQNEADLDFVLPNRRKFGKVLSAHDLFVMHPVVNSRKQ
jgi:uncharacterized protein (DUF1501 family)